MVLLVMPTRWFVCLSARGVGAGVGRLPVRVVVAVGVGAPGAWWAWLGAPARVGVYLVRVAGGLWAAGALLPCVWRFVFAGGAWPAFALRGLRRRKLHGQIHTKSTQFGPCKKKFFTGSVF